MAGRPNLGKKRIQVKISPEALDLIDRKRGKKDRSTFIEDSMMRLLRSRPAKRRR